MPEDEPDNQELIERFLRATINELGVGQRLPSTRSLVARFACSSLTVQAAVHELVAEGLIEPRPGSGNFTARPLTLTAADVSWQSPVLAPTRGSFNVKQSTLELTPPGSLGLHSGYPDAALLPERLVAQALGRASRSRDSFDRPPVNGLASLRTWFAREASPVGRNPLAPPSPDDVTIVSGGQSALATIFRAVTVAGDTVVMEAPTYWGAMAAARQTGLTIETIAPGVRPLAQQLDDVLTRTGSRLFYAQPHFANPTGKSWSDGDRRDVVDVLRMHGAFLIEDDWAHDFGIDETVAPLVAEDSDGRIIYVRSLSKSVGPSMRVAAIVARGPITERVQADAALNNMYVSGLLQHIAFDVVNQPGWKTHVARLRESLRIRRDGMCDALDQQWRRANAFTRPLGGLNVWLQLPDGVDDEQFVRRCAAERVIVSPGSAWFDSEGSSSFVRLNFAGAQPEKFADAMRTISALA